MNKNYTKGSASQKRPVVYQKTFVMDIPSDTASDLTYFVQQELGYYNMLVEKLTPRLKAHPKDLLNFKDTEKKLWEACAERAVDPQKLIDHPLKEWPVHLHSLHPLVYDYDGNIRISPAHISMIGAAASPARVHASVRKAMANEILNYMISQADTVNSAATTETMRVPVQLLQSYTFDNKRHLQIPFNLLTMKYDEKTGTTHIHTPYSRKPIIVPNVDLTYTKFKLLIVRSPHPTSLNKNWQIDLKDSPLTYIVNLTDYMERKNKKKPPRS